VYVAEGSGEDQREQVEGSKRRQRSDWFGHSLGTEWVETEPGIYRHQTAPAPREADAALDEELLDALPNDERDAEPEPEPPRPTRAPQRHWFRR
jgi:hypothetical protein